MNLQRVIDSPFSEGKAVLHEEMRDTDFRGEKFRYLHRNYRCEDTGMEFTSDDMDFDNMERIYAQYRVNHDIPSPQELKNMREEYGLSAAKMSEILGLGTNQYRRYEEGVMPSETIGKMLRSIQTPAVFLSYIEGCKNHMSEQDYHKLCQKIQKSFIQDIKRRPDLSWFREFLSFKSIIGKVAL